MTPRFDAQALLDAVEMQRQRRGLSWAELSRIVGVSASMIRDMPHKAELEADSVLQLARWLGRSVESFCGDEGAPAIDVGDPRSSGRVLRVDLAAMHAALESARKVSGMSWGEVAAQIASNQVTPSSLSKLDTMQRIGIHRLVAIARWLGQPIATFTRLTPR